MINFDPHTATQQELRDWLAEQDGWVKVKDVHGGNAWRKRSLLHDPHSNWSHPYPRTLDGAAAALPEGCRWTFNGEGFFAWKMTEWIPLATTASTGDEITDRYRLACLARVAMKENSK